MKRIGLGLASLFVVGAGCSATRGADEAPASAHEPEQAPLLTTSVARELIATLREQRMPSRMRVEPPGETDPVLPPAAHVSWKHDGAHLTPVFAAEELDVFERKGAATTTAQRVELRLPARANGAFSLRHARSGVAAEVTLQGGQPVDAADADGYVVYPEGGPGGADVLHRATPEGVEDYVRFVKRPAREEVTYRVKLEGVAGLRLMANTLELLDAGGAPRLRMAAPYAVDVTGKRIEGRVEIGGCAYDTSPLGPWGRPVTPPGAEQCEVKVTWDGGGVAYPLLVDPAWASTGSMAEQRTQPHGHQLSTGKVLVFGGNSNGGSLTSELWDPATGTWARAASLARQHGEGGSVLTGDGLVRVIGGWDGTTNSASEKYDPTTGTWSDYPGPSSVRNHTVVPNAGGFWVTGGRRSSGTVENTCEFFTSTGAHSSYEYLLTARYDHVAVYAGSLYVVGGRDSAGGYLTSVERLATNFVTAGAIGVPRARASAVYVNSILYVDGGRSSDTSTADGMSVLTSGTWTETTDGGDAYDRSTATLANGKKMFIGGRASTGVSMATFRDPLGAFSYWMSKGRGAPAAVPLADRRLLVAGGYTSLGADAKTAEVFSLDGVGKACSDKETCASGNCSDGVCCDAPCSAQNDSCLTSKTGLPTGTCGPVTNGASCSSGSDCASGFCSDNKCCDAACSAANDSCLNSKTGLPNGTCGPVRNGVACSTGSACGSGFCSDSVCCDAACSGTNDACVNTKTDLPDGTCGPIKNGYACSSNAQCGSGFCADGVCCSAACTGQCVSCKQADTGVTTGTCAPVTINTDPANECPSGGAPTCALPGMCNGNGACQNQAGTECGASTCSGSTYTPPSTCNSAGQCVTSAPGTCGNYLCEDGDSCWNSCTSSAQCTNGTQCVNGACGVGFGLGHACTNASECTSGNCADGVCCSTSCAGTCFSCKAASTGQPDGTCAVVKDGMDPDGDCAASGTPCGPDGQCNGQGACRGDKLGGTSCGAATCSGNNLVTPTCDGAGTCGSTPTPCAGGYVCAGGTCPTTCTTTCATGYYCNGGGSCALQLDNGTLCGDSTQCKSGQCVDGVCCESACGGACQSCAGVNTVGGIDGKCDAIKDGTDPRSACSKSGDACGGDGLCDGQGQCRVFAPNGSACGATVCVGPSVSGQLCDGKGVCAPAGTPVACPNNILCAAGVCPAECGSDSDCVTGNFCSQKACVPLLQDGATCGGDSQCANGHCVDGTCCNTSCTGTCQSCVGTQTGGVNGKCGNVLDGQDPQSDCQKSANPCGGDGLCDGQGQCRATAAAGTICGAPVCVGASIANQTCDGAGNCGKTGDALCPNGYACLLGVCPGTCADDTQCQKGYFCSQLGVCTEAQPSGAACTTAAQCKTGFCVDDVCCGTKCDGLCQACSSARTGGADGKCGNATDGSDPHNDCAKDAGNLCGADGMCDGQGQCRSFASTSKACGPTTCAAGQVSGKLCDGFGSCGAGNATKCQAGYGCNGNACATDCDVTGDTDKCAAGYTCKGGQCVMKSTAGAKCGAKWDCASGFCVDGVCCEAACDGACRSCSGINTVGGVDGKCDDVKSGIDPKNGCASDDSMPCGAPGYCGPGGKCATFAADGAKCGTNGCENATAVTARCDGAGTCQKLTTACGAYGCDAPSAACKTKCDLVGDCAAGAACDSNSHQCAFVGATCADGFTIKTADGKQVSCAPYRCEAGKCAEICTKPSECADGYDCVSTKCVKQTGQGGAGGAAGKGGAAGSSGTAQGGKAGGVSQGGSAQGGSVSQGGKAGATASAGAPAAGGTTAAGGGGASGGAKGGAPAAAPPAAAEDSGGCGCDVPGTRERPLAPFALALVAGLVVARRRRAG